MENLIQDRRFGVRSFLKLGASRKRVVQQLLTESVLLSIVSGLIGLGLSVFVPFCG